MKKTLTLTLLILLLCGCNEKKELDNKEVSTTTTVQTTTTAKIPEYVDNNPIKLGIYLPNKSINKRELKSEFTGPWKYYTDIAVFNIFYTQEEQIENNRIPIVFDKYAEGIDADKYHHGFRIQFEVGDTKIDKTILEPKDTEDFFEYLEIYLYDGYHRKSGEWYSHTTQQEFNENTRFTSIKLTTGKKVEEITSDLTLTAFSYDTEDDFDDNGNYRGNSYYTTIVKKK